MFITSLSVNNFKSYNTLDVDFNALNIIIGPNAAGKSNLFEIFKFLKKVASLSTLEQVFEQYNGFSKVCNALLTSKYILIAISGTIDVDLKKAKESYKLQSFKYTLKIEHVKTKNKTIINAEELQLHYKIAKSQQTELFQITRNRAGSITVKSSQNVKKETNSFQIPQTISILKFPFDDFVFIFANELSKLQYYKFDLDKIKNPVKYEESQKRELHKDGQNFAIFFKNVILKDQAVKTKLQDI